MPESGRYDECVMHRGQVVATFFAEYLAGRRVLFIGGAGFDPRACTCAAALADAGAQLHVCLVKEFRPGPAESLLAAAEANLQEFQTLDPDLQIFEVEIFDSDGAIVGGRRAVSVVSALPLGEYEEIVVDVSALSIGTSFPMVRFLIEYSIAQSRQVNLHVTVAHDPDLDAQIARTAGDRPGWVHGFSGDLGVDRDDVPAKLWMPQLAFGVRQEIARVYEFVKPDDTCPILPFPAGDPRLADRLAVEYRQELLETWDVDLHNIVYADEGDPLDVYRTILRIDDRRRPVFAGIGGSKTIVSPTSSKLTALGALMACVERDLPVAYLEAEDYELIPEQNAQAGISTELKQPTLVHLWLEGIAYPDTRSKLKREI